MDTSPLRGVVHHILPAVRRIRRQYEERGGAGSYTPPRKIGLDLWGRRGRIWKRPGVEHGACLWCLRGKPRLAYHDACKVVKNTFAVGGLPPGAVLGIPVCAKCDRGVAWGWPKREKYSWGGRDDFGDITFAVDHRVPLSIAYAVAGLDGWARAMLSGNLQWLCDDCHKAKTAEDLRTLAAIRRIDRGEQLKKPDRRRRTDPNQVSLAL